MSETIAKPTEPFGQDSALRNAYGFVPNLFIAQSLLPLAIDAEAHLLNAVVIREDRLSRRQKENILLRVAEARENDYCRALYGGALPGQSSDDTSILKFANMLMKIPRQCSGMTSDGVAVPFASCNLGTCGITSTTPYALRGVSISRVNSVLLIRAGNRVQLPPVYEQ